MATKIVITPELDEEKLREQLDKLKNQKEKIKVDLDTENINSANQNMKKLNSTVSNSNTIFGRLKNAIGNTFSTGKLAMTGYLAVLNEINKAGKNAKQTINDLDKAITDLSVATNMSRESVSGLVKDYNNYAKELKSTTTQITSAADDYLRAGKSMGEAQALIKDSIMLSKLGQLESGTATEDLLAVMNGYEMSIEEVGKALDAMVALDMAAATSSGDIATALKYCASSADVAGLSFNKLAAMITTVQDKTQQSAETIGTFMNTLLSRYRDVKIGQFISDDGEDLSDVEAVLNSLDIQLRDSSQEFRDFETVIEEVALSWDNYSSVQQAAIAKAFSGTRQQNRFLALMEGYNKTLELTEVAANSAGTAIKKFNNSYMNSLEAKQNALQASFESLILNADFSEVYSGIIEATTALVDFINQTNALKGALTGLTVAGGIKGFLAIKTGVNEAYIALNKFQNALNIVKKSNISTKEYERLLLLSNGLSTSQMKLVLSTNSLTVAQKKELLMASGLSEEEAVLQLQTWKMTAANTGLTASTVTLGNAFKALWSTLIANPLVIVTALISGAVMAYQAYNQKQEEARQAMQEAKQEYQNLTSEIDRLNEELETTRERLKELDAIGYDNLSLVEQEEYERLKATNEELEREYRIKEALAKVKAKEVADNARNTLSKRTQTSIEKVEYGAEGVALETTVDIVESVNEYINLAEKQRQSLEETKQALEDYENAYAGTAEEMVQDKSWQKLNDNVEKAENALSGTEKIISEKYESIEEEAEGLVDSFGNVVSGCEEMYQRVEDLKNRTDEYFNLVTDIQDEVKEIDSELEAPEIRITFEQAWADSFTSENDAIKELGNSLLELAEQGRLTIEAFNEADSSDYFKNLGISADEAVSKINKLVDESKQLSSMSDQISSMADALSTKLSDGFVSADTLSGFDVEVRGLESWDKFQEVLGSATSSYEECQEAANALATEWVNSSDFLAQLTEQNKEYYETQLQAMGVENYEEVIAYAQQLNVAKEALAQASFDVATATAEEIQAFINEGAYSELAQQQIWNLVLVKQTEEGITLDTSADCQNLLALAQNAGVTGDAIELLTQLLEIYNNLAAGTYGTNAQVINAVKNQANALKAQIDGIFANGASSDTVELDPKIKVSPSTKSSAKSAGKDTGDAYKDGLKEALNDIESVISGITKAIDGQISSINDEKSAALDAIDAEKEALEEERQKRLDVIEAQRKQIEQNIKAKQKIIDGINDEIKSMRDANDERKRQNDFMKAQYELERLQHQRTILQYSEDRGMHYVTNTKDVRSQKQAVEDAKLEIEIANKEKQIDLIEKEIDLLNDKLDLLDEEEDRINEFYDAQIKALEKQRKETESYFDSLIKNLENSKSKYEELTELLEKAELSAKLKQLGIDEEALLNGSEEEFEKLKQAYLDIVYQLNAGNDDVLSKLRELSGYNGTAPALLSDSNTELDTMNSELDTANQSVGNVNSSLGETASTTSDVATNVGNITTNLTEANGLVSEEQTAFNNLKQAVDEVIKAINQKTDAVKAEQEAVDIATSSEMADFLLLKEKILEVKETLESFGTQNEGLIHDIAVAIESLNEISLDEGIISQFTNLKEAIDSVTTAISGGGESSGGEGSGSGSGSGKGGESGGKGSKGEGGGSNSLTGAIEQMGETANEVIGEPDAEGDGTVIGEFGSFETAVNDVRDAIGTESSESGNGGSGGEGDDTLVGSIEYLGDKTEEELGEPDGDGIIGRFTEFKDVIEEAANQVKSISDGLDEIDGKEVECTITVNVKMNGSIPAFASGTVLGNMQIESATYNAQYGKAFASGTIGLPHAEKNALVSEYGQTEMTVLPDGKTIITDTPTLMDLPKDTVIYNEKETKKIMDNKINVSGNAHADGTDGNWWIGADGHRYRDLQPGDRAYELQKAFEPFVDKILKGEMDIVSNAVFEGQKQMEQWTQNIENINNITNNRNNNIQQPVVNHINVTCPGVTEQQVAERIGSVLGKELDKQFSGFHNYTDQMSRIR